MGRRLQNLRTVGRSEACQAVSGHFGNERVTQGFHQRRYGFRVLHPRQGTQCIPPPLIVTALHEGMQSREQAAHVPLPHLCPDALHQCSLRGAGAGPIHHFVECNQSRTLGHRSHVEHGFHQRPDDGLIANASHGAKHRLAVVRFLDERNQPRYRCHVPHFTQSIDSVETLPALSAGQHIKQGRDAGRIFLSPKAGNGAGGDGWVAVSGQGYGGIHSFPTGDLAQDDENLDRQIPLTGWFHGPHQTRDHRLPEAHEHVGSGVAHGGVIR